MARDDFTKDTVRRLAQRAGHRCSFEPCGAPTAGPSDEGPGAVSNVGVACHIAAASPGGRRFDGSMTPAERRSIENGIWMCQTHAKLIDDDEVTYTVEVLKGWKAAAEARAAASMGVQGGVRSEPVRPSPLYGVPRGTASFVGRKPDLDALKELLQSGGNIGVSASIYGLAGIGKTELAIRLARTLAAEGKYPGGIYWVDAEDPNLLGGWDSIGDEMDLPEGPERARQALRAVDGSGRKSLLILDNVTSWKAGERPKPLPGGENVQLLVTTRRKRLDNTFQCHRVQVLPPDAAKELLIKLGVEPTADGFQQLLKYLDGHALALELAGCYLGEYREESPMGYLERLTSGGNPGQKVVEDLGRYKRTVQQVLQVLWDRLDAQTQFHWQIMAQMAPAPASPRLMDACGVDVEARRGLGRLSLVDDTGGGWKKMHRLVQAFGLMGDTAEAEKAFFRGCCSRADTIEISTGYKVYLEDAPHLAKAIADAEQQESVAYDEFGKLMDRTAAGLQSAGRYRESRDLSRKALESDLKNFGESHPRVATRRSNLAGVLKSLGEFEGAKEQIELALESDLRNLGESHPNVAVRRSILAGVLQDLGEFEGAREQIELALESDLKSLEESHPRSGTATTTAENKVAIRRSNLARALHHLGYLEGAREQIELALESDLKNLGESHLEVATARSILAAVLKDWPDLKGAKKQIELALESDIANLGESHPYVAADCSILASVLHALGDLEGARKQAREARRVALLQPEGSRVRQDVLTATSAILSDPLKDSTATAESTTQTRTAPKVGRNQPCPCGSGKKYKRCHGR